VYAPVVVRAAATPRVPMMVAVYFISRGVKEVKIYEINMGRGRGQGS
jgi:hypothetical protein